MNSFTSRDYQLDKEYRDRKFKQDQDIASSESESSDKGIEFSHWMITAIILAICFASMLIFAPSAQAQMMQDSDASVDTTVELGLMMGAYYFNQERYEEAIGQFQLAIDGMPEAYFELAPEQAIVFWQLGEALEEAGYLSDALDSYERYLEIAGDGATEYAITYIADLQTQIDALNA